MEPALRAGPRAGDPDGFGALSGQHAKAAYNTAFRLTADWSAAADAVSLTFLQARRLRGRVEPDGESPRPWLLGSTVNVTPNMARAARRHLAAMRRPPPPDVPDRGTVYDPTCRFLRSLPADPHALLALIEHQMQGQLPRPEEAFTTIGDLIGEAVAPPRSAPRCTGRQL